MAEALAILKVNEHHPVTGCSFSIPEENDEGSQSSGLLNELKVLALEPGLNIIKTCTKRCLLLR